MPWNWELPQWPQFSYDLHQIALKEKQFLLSAGGASAYLKNLNGRESSQFVVEILSMEGLESSKIEGEILDRESLQSSIRQHFGIDPNRKSEKHKEAGMAKLLCDVYETYETPLTKEMLCKWHLDLFHEQERMIDRGKYRTHNEPMQIVSNRYDSPRVYFEAPPSTKIPAEMESFIQWFNTHDNTKTILERAAVAHVYFESIHPFEDGNGRIGRLLVEKILSQGVGAPVLIAVSKVLEAQKKKYYAELEKCNRTLHIQDWVDYFSDVILEGQKESMKLLIFLIQKSKIMTRISGQMNERQEKVLLRMFKEGPDGFSGGLSAENYISITKAARATATRDLADLVERDVLIKKGELRYTRYFLNLS